MIEYTGKWEDTDDKKTDGCSSDSRHSSDDDDSNDEANPSFRCLKIV